MAKKAARRPAPTLDPWCPIMAPDGRSYVIGQRAISMTATLPSRRRGFATLKRWVLVGPIVMSSYPKTTVIATADSVIYRLGESTSYEALGSVVKAALGLDLAAIGIEDTSVSMAEIDAALFYTCDNPATVTT